MLTVSKNTDHQTLRKRAVRLVRQQRQRRAAAEPKREVDRVRLIHELEVHQVEVQMQNEELRQARQELEEGLARYTELFEFAPIGYASLDRDGQITALNHAGAALLRAERDSLLGTAFAAKIAPLDRAPFASVLVRARASEHRVQTELASSNGTFLRVSAIAQHTSKFATLLAFEDITAQKQHEMELERSKEALRAADRRKDDFLALLSHELRNPLTPIRNCMFLLAEGGLNPTKSRHLVAVAERQVEHMSRLVDDLLDVTRIQRGIVSLQREPLDLVVLVRKILEDQSSGLAASGIRLDAQLGDDELWVSADPTRITQVLVNVLGNAEKFTPRGGQISVQLTTAEGAASLRVRDTGAGIAPEMLETLFEPFTQAPQTMDRARGGLGLGLSMVKGFVELHGGTVRMESAGLGRGSELTIDLPLTAPPPRDTMSQPQTSRAGRRVLVVEDNEDAAETLSIALGSTGHEVAVAYDGQSALEQARDYEPEVVICDIGLPGMDGYEVARAFRAKASLRTAYLIALSGYALPEDRQRSLAAGFDKHVAKPPSMKEINRLIAAAPPRARSSERGTAGHNQRGVDG